MISVVIITRNQRTYLEQSLPALKQQTGFGESAEIVVVDSGSIDGAQDVVRRCGARLIAIESSRFNYARAYNAGAHVARGRYLARLSGDAVPIGDRYLHSLVQPMEDDATIAATWGRQEIPASVRNPIERWFEERLRPASGIAQRRYTRDVTVLGSAMALRRELGERRPFDERLPQAEDYDWMHHWYRRGFAGLYVPAAVIRHGHDEPLHRALRRSIAQSVLQGLILLKR